MQKWDLVFIESLLSARDYRSFLKLFFQKDVIRSCPRPLSYQSFADRAGFASKGFMADVLAGRKRLTLRSYTMICSGLALNHQWSEYLRLLISLEENDFMPGRWDRQKATERLDELKKRLRKKTVVNLKGPSKKAEVVLQPSFPEIYAALGSAAKGASTDEIMQRTQHDREHVVSYLAQMQATGLVSYDEGTQRYKAQTEALEIQELRSAQFFQRDFFRSLERAKTRFSKQAHSGEALFMNQTFSTDSKRLAEFKVRLAELINQFADEAEVTEGDTVADICISFTSTL